MVEIVVALRQVFVVGLLSHNFKKRAHTQSSGESEAKFHGLDGRFQSFTNITIKISTDLIKLL